MKLIYLLFVSLLRIKATEERLIEKNSKATTETKIFGAPVVRHTRDVFEEDALAEFSKEENEQIDQLTQLNGLKMRYYYKYNPMIIPVPVQQTRLTRGSISNVTTTKNSLNNSTEKTKVLIQRPIPKFDELDDEDDFQMNMDKTSNTFIDSNEHEDEDFNLDDYDFDVNHDEFIGSGKPLQPRTKNKDLEHHHVQTDSTEGKPQKVASEIKVKSKILPPINAVSSNKKQRHVTFKHNKENKVKFDEYYDDDDDVNRKEVKKYTDEIVDENYESGEPERGMSNRDVRSPWKIHKYVDKLSEKSPTATVMSKTLSIFPTFP
ncbi:uncharacterized protein LOC101745285 [Bombyx mori]|uniref:Seminal fluid protein n=1 Tax=Bombyx mori TaxID=7091 RepID=A0A8R2AML3_BOMMO|nr:uncharacterized protein LOC101745285 [Bombyx mori]